MPLRRQRSEPSAPTPGGPAAFPTSGPTAWARAKAAARRGAGALAGAAALGAALVAGGCGGDSKQVVAFQPQRLVALGDESSMIVDVNGDADGFKYTINDRTSTSAGKCNAQPIFVQLLAAQYAMVFAECNPEAKAVKAFIGARAGATVESASSGLAAQIASLAQAPGPTDLFSVMIGANDILGLYDATLAGTLDAAGAQAEAKRRGAALAQAIDALLATGARAIVYTIADQSLTPYIVAQERLRPGAAALVSSMSQVFNAELRVGIDPTRYDGRNYGLVVTDDIVGAMARFPGAYLSPPANAVDAACTTPSTLACTTTTLVAAANASATTYLWAGDRHLAPAAHLRIGDAARNRAANNPF